jgi:hypothetical protein
MAAAETSLKKNHETAFFKYFFLTFLSLYIFFNGLNTVKTSNNNNNNLLFSEKNTKDHKNPVTALRA